MLPTPPTEEVGRATPLVARPVAPEAAEPVAVARPADSEAQYSRLRALSSPVQTARSQEHSSSLRPPATHLRQVAWQSSLSSAEAVEVAEGAEADAETPAQ